MFPPATPTSFLVTRITDLAHRPESNAVHRGVIRVWFLNGKDALPRTLEPWCDLNPLHQQGGDLSMSTPKIENKSVKIADKKFRRGSWVALCVFLSSAMLARAAAKIQTPSDSDKEFQTLIRSVEGPDLFRAYCASCHGKDGKGNGPAAPALKATVPDLTLIAKRNGGKFPQERVRRIVMGEGMIASHGSREMPVWGPIFHQVESDVDLGYVRVDNLLKYLRSIQVGKQT
jgi:mono/diheme cytochrome c family protein